MTETISAASDAPESPGPLPSPDGYAGSYEFRYPTVVLLLGSGFLGIISAAIFISLLSLVQGPEIYATLFDVVDEGDTTTVVMDVQVLAVPFIISLFVTVVIHELLHGAVFGIYGHDVKYGVAPTMGAFYVAALGQFQTREELFRVALAPIILITIVCIPLLAVPIPIIAITALFVLILNSAGAVGDLYITWRLFRMPPKTLMYDVDIRHSYVYEPVEQ